MMAAFAGRRRVDATTSIIPEQTAQEIVNPDRGVCPLIGCTLGKDMTPALNQILAQTGVSLVLIEINLKEYQNTEIDESALTSLDTFLGQAGAFGDRLILRFLYDTDGTAALTEPDSIETVLIHMRQVGPILRAHADEIYTLQGLFTGNWGEMNGSRFGDAGSLIRLYNCLRESTGGTIRMAVRTPAQWRMIQQADVTEDLAATSGLGLFNDGLTGSETDCGTYADGTAEDPAELTDAWPRERELAFQEMLCRFEPNGGEAILPGVWNDLPQALESFRQMHVSYLNPDYDSAVWDKWRQAETEEDGVFDGMNGADYIRCHLGYRFVLDESDVTYSWLTNRIRVSLIFRNIGFAPAYEPVIPVLSLCSSDGETVREEAMPGDLRGLAGGTDRDREMAFQTAFTADDLTTGIYTLRLRLRYGNDQALALGNVSDSPEEAVYTIGTIHVR
jgi:hypothetical protein